MRYDELANRIATEYDLFLFALSGRYAQVRTLGVTARSISDLHRDAHSLALSFLHISQMEIEKYLTPVKLVASETMQKLLDSSAAKLESEVSKILMGNISQAVALTKTGNLNLSSLIGQGEGAMGVLARRKSNEVAYKSKDSAGRTQDSKRLLRLTVRDFAYQAQIEAQVTSFLQAGIDLVITSTGEILSLSSTFNERKSAVFHPNSNTTMSAYVPS